jgi:cytochrome c-type biogenesis protein CcmF
MNDLGVFTLIVSLALTGFSLSQSIYGIIKNNQNSIELGRISLMANSFVILLSFAILMTQLIRMDLSNHYVVMHSGEHLPLFYRITSIWSGSSGSLLFWNLLLNLFTFIVLYETRKISIERLPILNISMGVLVFFFTYLAVYYPDAQPFREFQPKAVIGRGLNPLLQHWAMIIHPPILYIGYVSFAIPFGIGMSALIKGTVSQEWMKQIRRWTLFSWFFLGVGILLGSKWAYEELGWGGYWAWDPVENASLMPWLLSSAFIHSIIIEERRGMLKFWNMLLIILTFHFTLLGTWITRSGVLEGPHSFSKSTIGTPFLVFIIISFLIYTGILVFKRESLKPERDLEALTSKEGSFFLNNFILVLACLVILLGVFSPLLYGKEFKSPWYNSWGIPAGIFLLLLMGASPLLAWRKGADTIFFRTLFKPFLVGLFFAFLYSISYSKVFTKSDYSTSDTLAEIYSILTIGLGFFTIAGIIQEFHQGIRARTTTFSENYFKAGLQLILKNKRRYGGYLVHLSIVILFIGYSGNAFRQNTSFQFYYTLMEPNSDEIIYRSSDKAILGNYIIEAESLKIKPIKNGEESSNKTIFNTIVSEEASYKVTRHLKNMGDMVTERRFYPQISHLTGGFETHIPTSEPSILSTPKEDLYIQLGAIETGANSLENPELPMLFMNFYFGSRNFKDKEMLSGQFPSQLIGNLEVWVNPLVKLIWLGSFLFFLSGLLIIVPIGAKT